VLPARSAADPTRSASRPASARRAAAAGAARRTRAPQPHRLTGRATVLGLVLGALLLAYAYPVRIYLNQQTRIAAIEASQTEQRRKIGEIKDETAKYSDPSFIQAQATRRLGMTTPGAKTFKYPWPGASTPAPTDPGAAQAKDPGPWYGELWSSVQAADKPQTAP
jgi:cell division protein FtsB